MKKKYVSNNKKQRVILSDILPYEIPVIFSNRYFYRFLVENQISIKEEGKKLNFTYNQASKNNDVIDKFLTLLMAKAPKTGNFESHNSKTIPFKFKIAHKDNDYRELSIIHPINQMLSIEFYDEYKELIPYYASVSKFSLRAPHQIAKLGYYNDYYHRLIGKINNDSSNIEMQNQEEEHLKSFFTYQKYSNIYKFFESREYHDCEKRFNYLYQFDIQKCFDSIYTHTLAWALLNKQVVKDNLGKEKPTLAGKFDKLMQDMNYGETNGILIGSETSRIFAELLLQKIDKQVLDSLNQCGIIYKTDYEIFRYVDDYFVFYTSENTKNNIIEIYRRVLSEYKLFISEAKTKEYAKPIVTNLTIAKTKINQLLSDTLQNKSIVNENDDKRWHIKFNSNQLITKFKIIVSESNVDYKGIINYSIAIIERIVLSILNKFEQEPKKQLYTDSINSYLYEIIDLVFFIYSVSPRVSVTVKIVSLISKIINFIRNCIEINEAQKHTLYAKAYVEIYNIIKHNSLNQYTQNETLYLLILLTIFDKEYLLEEDVLMDYFFSGEEQQVSLNYFAITTLLFYMRNFKKYKNLKNKIFEEINTKFNDYNPSQIRRDTELVMLLLDLIKCPYIGIELKRELLEKFDIQDHSLQSQLINLNKFWFIKWTNFDLIREIDWKKGFEVYS